MGEPELTKQIETATTARELLATIDLNGRAVTGSKQPTTDQRYSGPE